MKMLKLVTPMKLLYIHLVIPMLVSVCCCFVYKSAYHIGEDMEKRNGRGKDYGNANNIL